MVRTFQLTKSLNRMTVMDNMMLGARGQRGENLLTSMFKSTWAAQEKAIEAKAYELLHRFKLYAKKDDYAGSLSGGQRKLLEMARALMSDPTMIMLDEPMAGVNPALTQSLLGHIQTLRDEGMTVLFVEHDMHVVRHISDWVVVMAEGRIVAEGPADSVMSNPAVIDAYLGAHHDTDLGDDSLLSDEALEEMAQEVAAEEAERAGAGEQVTAADADQRDRATQPRGEAVIEAKDIVAGYLPGVNILNGCSLVAYPGEMIGIIGPNGAGKSTLLKAMFGLVRVHSGQVTLHGKDITNLKANRLVEIGVGFVPQTNNVFPTLTIEENLRMGLYLRPQKLTERLAAMWDLFPVLHDRSQPARRCAVRR